LLGSALTENRLICQFREMVEAGCLASYGIGLTTRLLAGRSNRKRWSYRFI